MEGSRCRNPADTAPSDSVFVLSSSIRPEPAALTKLDKRVASPESEQENSSRISWTRQTRSSAKPPPVEVVAARVVWKSAESIEFRKLEIGQRRSNYTLVLNERFLRECDFPRFKRILRHVKNTRATLDVDVLDTSVGRANEFAVEGGLGEQDLIDVWP